VGGLRKQLTFKLEKGIFLVLCELCLKMCFKICCLEGNQQQAVWPGNSRWHHFREHDCKTLKHSL